VSASLPPPRNFPGGGGGALPFSLPALPHSSTLADAEPHVDDLLRELLGIGAADQLVGRISEA
jgi:hypothetical protein